MQASKVTESTGVPGRIHVSEATYTLIKDEFDFEQRAPIEVKGKGMMTTYLLSGVKSCDPARRSSTKLT